MPGTAPGMTFSFIWPGCPYGPAPTATPAYFAGMSDFRLRVFAAVARHLRFTKAGQELFVSQPAVIKYIR